jgi:glycine zipper-containing protein DUF883
MTAANATHGATRTLHSDLAGIRAQIADAVRERPLAATAVAAGVGFVLGGGLTRRVMTLLIATGARAVAMRIGEGIRQMENSESFGSARARGTTSPNEPRTGTGGTRS